MYRQALTLTLYIVFFMAGATVLAPIVHAVSYPAGLAAYWNVDEGSGTVAHDALGASDAAFFSVPAWTAGQVGGALDFDGADDHLIIADSSALDAAGALTIEAWIYPKSLGGEVLLFAKGGSGCDTYNSFLKDAKLALLSSDGCSWGNTGGNSAVQMNAWQHIAVTYDGSHIRYYINGALIDTVAADGLGAENTQPLTIAKRAPWGDSVYFKGTMDEIAFYTSTLPAATIEQHYLAGLAGNSYFPEGNTPEGSNVEVAVDDAIITFSSVETTGNTTITTTESGEPLPGGFQIGGMPTYYIVETTATFSGQAAICMPYDENALSGSEDNLRVLHFSDGQWVDVTNSLDTEANTICFEVESFSQFAIVLQQTISDLAGMVQDAGLPKGIARSLLGKLSATQAAEGRDDNAAAMHMLKAFIRGVRALEDMKITAAQANEWADYAENLIAGLEE